MRESAGKSESVVRVQLNCVTLLLCFPVSSCAPLRVRHNVRVESLASRDKGLKSLEGTAGSPAGDRAIRPS